MRKKEIYIVVMQTGTILSRMLKRLTGKEYNHVSVSFDPDLHYLYSFGRKNAYNPWIGGFVQESLDFGTLKRFSETRAVVMSLPVEEEIYDELVHKINEMFDDRDNYYYDSLGLILACFNVIYKRDRHYYCSSFVRELLVDYGIEDSEQFESIVQPMHFLDLPDGRVIYRGRLRDFARKPVNANAS